VAVEPDGEDEQLRGVHGLEALPAQDKAGHVEEGLEVIVLVVRGVLGKEEVDLPDLLAHPLAQGVEPAEEVEIEVLPVVGLLGQEAKQLAARQRPGNGEGGPLLGAHRANSLGRTAGTVGGRAEDVLHDVPQGVKAGWAQVKAPAVR